MCSGPVRYVRNEVMVHMRFGGQAFQRVPLSHDCLARVFSVRLAPKDREKSFEMLNTSVRGQIVLGSDESADIDSINGMLQLCAYMQTLPLEGKKQAMLGLVAGSLAKNTFGVSYTGNISWGGMDQYQDHPWSGIHQYHQTEQGRYATRRDGDRPEGKDHHEKYGAAGLREGAGTNGEQRLRHCAQLSRFFRPSVLSSYYVAYSLLIPNAHFWCFDVGLHEFCLAFEFTIEETDCFVYNPGHRQSASKGIWIMVDKEAG